MKKYQSGGKTSKGSAFKSASDSTTRTNSAINTMRNFEAARAAQKKNEGTNYKAENRNVTARRKVMERDPDVQRLRQGTGYSPEDRKKAIVSSQQTPGGIGFYSGKRDEDYKKGGTIKNPTAMKKQKTAPKKKMSAKEMEAMKKANTPMMKYGGKMGKKSC